VFVRITSCPINEDWSWVPVNGDIVYVAGYVSLQIKFVYFLSDNVFFGDFSNFAYETA